MFLWSIMTTILLKAKYSNFEGNSNFLTHKVGFVAQTGAGFESKGSQIVGFRKQSTSKCEESSSFLHIRLFLLIKSEFFTFEVKAHRL